MSGVRGDTHEVTGGGGERKLREVPAILSLGINKRFSKGWAASADLFGHGLVGFMHTRMESDGLGSNCIFTGVIFFY
jgi:hypothetical protein